MTSIHGGGIMRYIPAALVAFVKKKSASNAQGADANDI